MDAETYPSSWLVLLAQLPSKPSSARVVLWRRMRAAGATPRGERRLDATPQLLRTRISSNNRAKASSGGAGPGSCCESRAHPRNRMNRSCGFSSPTGPVNMASSRSAAPPFSMRLTGSPPRDGIIPLPWRPSPKSVDLASTVTTLPAPLVTQTTTVKHSA